MKIPNWLKLVVGTILSLSGAMEYVVRLLNFTDYGEKYGWVVMIIGAILCVICILGYQIVESGKKPKLNLNPDSKYRKRYLEYLVDQYKFIDLRGLPTTSYPLGLEQIFVQLEVSNTPYHDISANPIHKTPTELRQRSNDIWTFLTTPSEPFFGRGKKRHDNFVILGAPGSGKTTLIKEVTLALAQERVQNQQQKQTVAKWLPIFLFLRSCADEIKDNPKISLVQIIQESVKNLPGDQPENFFLKSLEQGDCLVMLDGLDEIPDKEKRKAVVDWVDQQMSTYGNSHFIITSRKHGYSDNPLNRVKVLEILEFTSEQVRTFIQNWYLANERRDAGKDDQSVRQEAQQKAGDLFQRLIKKPALDEMARNPLLLTMIATVHRFQKELPERRVDLYSDICRVFLSKRDESRNLSAILPAEESQQVLQHLAYHMMEHQQSQIALGDALVIIRQPLSKVSKPVEPKEFLDWIEKRSALLLELSSGVYHFAHLTFQEFLASVQMKEHNLIQNDLVNRVNSAWWRETLFLYATQGDADTVVEACFNPQGKFSSKVAMRLALDCRSETDESETGSM